MTTLYEVERTGIYADLDATVITIAVKNGVVIAALTAAVPTDPAFPACIGYMSVPWAIGAEERCREQLLQELDEMREEVSSTS